MLLGHADDVILSRAEVPWLEDVFGERARIFPTGGHCGSMDQREFVREMLRADLRRRRRGLEPACARGPGAGRPALAPAPRLRPISWAPRRRAIELTARMQAVDIPLRVYDPWEGTNRGLYKFNALFDEYVFLPVVDAYEFVTPDFIEDRVTDFFSNLTEFRNATNGLMQARPDVAGPGGDPLRAQLDDRGRWACSTSRRRWAWRSSRRISA